MVYAIKSMKNLLALFILLQSFSVLASESDEGPSSLEGEFFRQSRIHLPVQYTPIAGLSFDFSIPKDETDQTEDDLFGDITGLTVNFTPLVNASLEKIKRLVNQEQSSNSLNIEAASDNTPYLLIENKKWDLGLGLEATTDLPSPLSVAGIGFSFLKGKNYYSIKNLKHKHEKRPALAMPTTWENLQNWRVGDQLFYATRGGIVLNVFLGFKPFVSIGPEYLHSGSYRIKAHLLAADLMEIEITTTKTDTIGIEAGSLPMKVEVSKGKGILDAMIYHFDLKNPGAPVAMENLLKGRLDLTNKEMLLVGGQIMLTTKIQHTYTSIYGKYGLPFIYTQGASNGLSYSEGNVEKTESGKTMKLEVFSTSSIKERFSGGIFSHKKWYNETLASTVLREATGDGSVITSYYSWSFSKDHMSSDSIAKKLNKLADIFGTEQLRELKFHNTKLGYLKLDFGINFSGSDVLFLLNTANLRMVEESALKNFERDFELKGLRAFCKIRTYNDCFNRHYTQIESKFEQLKEKVVSLDRAYREDDIKEVTKTLTKIINDLFKSKYLTRSFVKSRPGLLFELRLEGESIKKHTIKL
ncbi:MAG TPA: hypothetical protein VNJ08_11835 [Bacteriovoracaceae bacterium]|nr:hypothetical protein [Bacteriovoracaceae bacterium]